MTFSLWNEQLLVNTTTVGDQVAPTTAQLANGNIVVTWGSGTNSEIFFQMFTASGEAIGSETQANTTTSLDQEAPDIVALANGNFVIAWRDEGNTSLTAQIFRPDGVKIGGEITLHGSSVLAPQLLANNDGGFVASWASSSGNDILSKRFDADGTLIGGLVNVSANATSNLVTSDLALLDNGNIVHVWRNEGDLKIRGAIYDQSGNQVGGFLEITNQNLLDNFRPSVTALAGGGFVVSWDRNDGFDKVIFRIFDSDGIAVTGEVDTTSSGGAKSSRVLALPDGGFALAMQRTDSGFTDDVALREYDSSGNLIGNGVISNVGAQSGIQSTPDLALTQDGRVVVVWTDFGQNTGDTDGNAVRLVIHSDENSPDAYGDGTNESLNGTSEADAIYGGGGDDTINGNGGNDVLDGGQGSDIVNGSGGDDLLIESNFPGIDIDTYDGGSGIDTLAAESIDYSDTVEFNLTSGRVTLNGVNEDHLLNIENLRVTGSAAMVGNAEDNVLIASELFGIGDNTIRGKAGNDTIYGFGGADYLLGNQGNDTVYGGDGDDTLDGGNGSDSVFGEGGNDIIEFSSLSTNDYFDGGSGSDTLRFTGTANSGMSVFDLEAGVRLDVPGGSVTHSIISFRHFEFALNNADVDVIGTSAGNIIELGDGDSIIEGGAGDDTIRAGGGSDEITGGNGSDYIYGEGGDDTINQKNTIYHDVIDGGSGIDTLDLSGSSKGWTIDLDTEFGAVIDGDGTLDPISIENIIGTAYSDGLSGTIDDNEIDGGGGNDVFWGRSGNDTIFGGTGDDIFLDLENTSVGNHDVYEGGANNDTVSYIGMDYDDTEVFDLASGWQYYFNTVQADQLISIENLTVTGSARIIGSFYDNVLIASDLKGERDNIIFGGAGNDTIEGGGGNDSLQGGVGADNVDGGTGDDEIILDPWELGDLFDGGEGTDTLTHSGYIDGGTQLEVNIKNGDLEGFVDVILNFENVDFRAGQGAYTIAGNNDANIIRSGEFADEDDVLTGDDGDDELWSYGGDDTLTGGGGSDIIRAGSGNDTIVQTNDGRFNDIDGGADFDTLDLSGSSLGWTLDLQSGTGSVAAASLSVAGIEKVIGTNYIDVITGDDEANTIEGGSANDTISGGAGDDIIEGGASHDILSGGADNDTISGGNGNDDIFGNRGIDYINADPGNDDIDGGLDFDRVNFADSNAGVIVDIELGTGSGGYAEGDTYIGIERVTGSEFDDTITGNSLGNSLRGRGGIDTIFGESGRDVIEGDDGDDILHGGAQNDNIFGDADNDQLFGDGGLDKLYGGDGDDTMTGGADADYFVFETGTNGFGGDIILDFEDGVDKLDVRGVFSVGNPANVADDFSDFTVETSAAYGVKIRFEAGQVIYLDDTLNGITVADIDASDFVFA